MTLPQKQKGKGSPEDELTEARIDEIRNAFGNKTPITEVNLNQLREGFKPIIKGEIKPPTHNENRKSIN